MSKADELLRRALDYIDQYDSQGLELYGEIETYLSSTSDDAEEPVAIIEEADYGCWGQILPDKSVRLGQFLYLHPPKPADIVGEMRETIKMLLNDVISCECDPDDPWCPINNARATLKRLDEL